MASRPNALTSALLVCPLLIVYQIGVLAMPSVHNGADLITSELLHLLHGNIELYLLLNLALAAAFLIAVLVLRRTSRFEAQRFLPVLLESAIYAMTMGSLICFVMLDFLHIDPQLRLAPHRGPGGVSLLGKIILSLGAGVHEELLFRLALVGGGAWLLTRILGLRRLFALPFVILVSSLLFSLAHHLIGGEPFRVGAFVYRTLCGVIFALLFCHRGFAVAVYTHALYDIYVLIVRG